MLTFLRGTTTFPVQPRSGATKIMRLSYNAVLTFLCATYTHASSSQRTSSILEQTIRIVLDRSLQEYSNYVSIVLTFLHVLASKAYSLREDVTLTHAHTATRRLYIAQLRNRSLSNAITFLTCGWRTAAGTKRMTTLTSYVNVANVSRVLENTCMHFSIFPTYTLPFKRIGYHL